MPGYTDEVLDWLLSEAGLQTIAGDSLTTFSANNSHLAAANPLSLEGGLRNLITAEKVRGIPRGRYVDRSGRPGGVFKFDIFECYRQKPRKILHNTNVMVFGEPGHHKSGDAKCDVYRDAAAGYNTLVVDVTGEWIPVANAIPGSKVLKFGDTSDGEERAHINPLDKSIKRTHQRDLIAGMVVTKIGAIDGRPISKLSPEQQRLIMSAIKAAHAKYGTDSYGLPTGVATLPDAVAKLGEPDEDMALDMKQSRDELVNVGRQMFYALGDLVEEDLKGIVDQETNFNLWQDTPLLVMCCAGMNREVAVHMALLIEFFSRSQYAIDNPRFRIHHRVDDEFWDLARIPVYVESVRDDFKQSGKRGFSRKVITHHLQNLHRSGSPAVHDLVSDSDLKICYRMHPGEVRDSAEALKFTDIEQLIVTKLPSGVSMWKVRDESGLLVQREAWPEEMQFVETRGLMHGRARMTDAELAEFDEPEMAEEAW